MDFFGAPQSRLHVVADVLRAHYLFKLCLMNQAGGLLARAAENQSSIAGVQLAGNFLDGE
jgi:hypothetical protein